MDLEDLLRQLREERDELDVAIATLERLEHQHHGGRGRSRGSVKEIQTNGTGLVNGSANSGEP